MKRSIESFIQRESVWPDRYDDRIIDDMIFRDQLESIGDEARARYETIDHSLDTAPVCYERAIEHY